MSRIVNNCARVLACLIAFPMLLGAQPGAEDSNDKVFNAVDGVPHELMVAVGDHGLIVHFPAGENPRRMPSGTDRDLLDVNVAASDFAIAVGRGIVLLWDGRTWTPVVEEEDVAPFSQAWASPDHHFFIYGRAEPGVFRLCPRLKLAANQPFCRQFPAPLRAACGQKDSVILLFADGAIYRVNDALIGHDGDFEPAFQPGSAMQLKSAWLSHDRCDSQARLPEAFAVDVDGRLIHFDGARWRPADDGSGVAQKAEAPLQPIAHLISRRTGAASSIRADRMPRTKS